MFRKLCFPVLIVLLLAVLTASSAQAAFPGQSLQERVVGIVTGLGESKFTLKTRRGEQVIRVDENTRYFSRSGSAGFEDLKIDQLIGVSAARSGNGDLLAAQVVIVGTAGTRLQPGARTVRGEIWSINLSTGTLVLHSGREELLFYVTNETNFRSPGDIVQGLADLAVHQHILVHFQLDRNGSLAANLIVAGAGRTTVHRGEVVTVDLVGASLSLARRDGQIIKFSISDETEVVLFPDQEATLEDLQPGMLIQVISRTDPAGTPVAIKIVYWAGTS